MKKLLTIFAMAVMGLNTTFAQNIADNGNIANYKLIKHLDLGLTLGSDGIGLELTSGSTYGQDSHICHSLM